MFKTIEELYKDAVRNGYEQFLLQVQYSNDDAYYEGSRYVEVDVDADKKIVTV